MHAPGVARLQLCAARPVGGGVFIQGTGFRLLGTGPEDHYHFSTLGK
jgi:hypothetical protein